MITIFTRKDLISESENKPLEEVRPSDLRRSIRSIQDSEFSVFVDEDRFKILKNRLSDPERGKIVGLWDLSSLLMTVMYSSL